MKNVAREIADDVLEIVGDALVLCFFALVFVGIIREGLSTAPALWNARSHHPSGKWWLHVGGGMVELISEVDNDGDRLDVHQNYAVSGFGLPVKSLWCLEVEMVCYEYSHCWCDSEGYWNNTFWRYELKNMPFENNSTILTPGVLPGPLPLPPETCPLIVRMQFLERETFPSRRCLFNQWLPFQLFATCNETTWNWQWDPPVITKI